jgi:hypothetical protein
MVNAMHSNIVKTYTGKLTCIAYLLITNQEKRSVLHPILLPKVLPETGLIIKGPTATSC